MTGCLHEDGLADTADGFGGVGRERKLEIMRDSRLGTYGACALLMSLLLRWSALASIADARAVALALVAAHAAARAPLPAFMALVPPARSDGLAAAAGPPPHGAVAAAGLLGALALGLCLGPMAAVVALVLLAAAAVVVARVSVKAIGGHTGDVLGALEQVNEILVLLVAATFARPGASSMSELAPFDDAFRSRLRDLFVWRRDVRRFRRDPLPAGTLERLIEIACLSPSVGLSQPWRFVIVDDPGRRQAVRDEFRACNARGA